MSTRIQLRKGTTAQLPTSNMLTGEPLLTTDRTNLYVATDSTTKVTVTPAIDSLSAIDTVDGANDLLMIYDADATGKKEKRVSVSGLKTALNIPDGDTDEKVAIANGKTARYLFNSLDPDNGALRASPSITIANHTGDTNAIQFHVEVVDGGTFI